MKTVKEISQITGISVRALHYYDEIGLLKPTDKTEAGYRLYDDKALETLQQVLFFREFDISLKDIKAIINDPGLDRRNILLMQKKMLEAKRDRILRLISGIDDYLRGEEDMDFTVFDKTELEELFKAMLDHLPQDIKEMSAAEFGGVTQWKKHYMEVLSSEKMQRGYAKVIEWYGGKEKYMDALKNPVDRDTAEKYDRLTGGILERLAAIRHLPPDSPQARELVERLGSLMKEFSRISEESGLMLSMAKSYDNSLIKDHTDKKYGQGASDFFARAISSFYQDR